MPEEIKPEDNQPCPLCQSTDVHIYGPPTLIMYCQGCYIRFDFKAIASSLGGMLAAWKKLPRHYPPVVDEVPPLDAQRR